MIRKLLPLLLLLNPQQVSADIDTNIDDVQKVTRMSTQECLVYNLYHESRGESDLANIMILGVVYNRVKSDNFPSTPCEVIKQKSQFEWTQDGRSDKLLDKSQVKRLSKLVDKFLLHKKLFISLSGGADHYHATSIKPFWSKSKRMEKIAQYDRHIFYKRN